MGYRPTYSVQRLKERINAKYQDQDYLTGRFLQAVQYCDLHFHREGRLAVIAQGTVIVSTALTALLIGLAAIWPDRDAGLKAVSLATSLLATALAGFMHFLGYPAKSLTYRALRERLIAEFHRFDQGIDPYGAGQDIKAFATRVEDMLAEANAAWSTSSMSQGVTP